MIKGRQRPVWPAHFQPALLKRGERLRRRHFMNKVKVDIKDGRRLRRFINDDTTRP